MLLHDNPENDPSTLSPAILHNPTITKRFIAFGIDFGIMFFSALALGVLFIAILSFFHIDDNEKIFFIFQTSFGLFLFYIFPIIYFILSDMSKHSCSPGKSIMKLKVIRLDGSKLSINKSILRNSIFMIVALTSFIGMITVFLNKHRLGLHEIISKTKVITSDY